MLRCLGMRRRRATCRIRRRVVLENGACSAAAPPPSVVRVKIFTAHVGTARRGLGEKCVLPRLDIGCRDHGLNCWNTDHPAGRAVISALTGLFCYVLPWRFLWEGCAGCASLSLPFCLPSTVGSRGLSASIGTLSGEGSSRSQFFRPAVPSRGYFSHSLPRRLPTS